MDINQNNVNDQTELKARGNWNQLKGEAKQKWGNLTDDDLTYEDGKQDQWFGQLQENHATIQWQSHRFESGRLRWHGMGPCQ